MYIRESHAELENKSDVDEELEAGTHTRFFMGNHDLTNMIIMF
jgi:hypothetical protein